MKRQVIKFNDIKGMLNADELKGILGGSGGGCGTTYYGGTLDNVTITAPGNNPSAPPSSPPSGYPNGYPTGGGSTNIGGSGSTGGTPASPETNYYGGPYNISEMNSRLTSFVKTHFPTENDPNLLWVTGRINPGQSGVNPVPPGYTMGTDGSYIDSNGTKAYGVTYKSGELTFIYISPFVMDNVTDSSKAGIIGHELIHAQDIMEHPDTYTNNFTQFTLNSELAAYTYQYNFAASINDQATADACYAEISSLIAQGATGGFSTSLHAN